MQITSPVLLVSSGIEVSGVEEHSPSVDICKLVLIRPERQRDKAVSVIFVNPPLIHRPPHRNNAKSHNRSSPQSGEMSSGRLHQTESFDADELVVLP